MVKKIKSGMSLDRAVRVQGRAESMVIELFSCTRAFRRTYGAHMEAAKRVWAALPENTPQWVRSYIQGFQTALWKSLYQHELEFCYRDKDGTLYSTHRESTHRLTQEFYDRNEGHLLADMVGDHYWKGSSLVWSTSELTTEAYFASLNKEKEDAGHG